jgi:hypothetical protein
MSVVSVALLISCYYVIGCAVMINFARKSHLFETADVFICLMVTWTVWPVWLVSSAIRRTLE